MSGVEAGKIIGGRYKVVREIGRGGMGIVYIVEHAHTGERLALKVLVAHAATDEDAVARFKREARASTRIQSDHVVRVTDADVAPELGGAPFMVMELLDGLDLEKLLERDGPMKPDALVRIMDEVGRALGRAHRLGIVHRDLKPENLFLHKRPDGVMTAKILDFGISKIIATEVGLETAGMTATGSVLGTPLFMSPEQAHGDNEKIGPSTDIWALGLVTMRLLTGESYWPAKNMAELMMYIVVKPMSAPSERWPGSPLMTPALDAWFARSCHRDQAARFTTVEEQVTALADALGVAIPSSAASSAERADGTNERTAPSSPPQSREAGDGTSEQQHVALARTAPLERPELARTVPAHAHAHLPAQMPTPSVMATSVAMGGSTPPSADRTVEATTDRGMAALARSTGATKAPRSRTALVIGVVAATAAAAVIAVGAQQYVTRGAAHEAIDAALATDLATTSPPAAASALPAASASSSPSPSASTSAEVAALGAPSASAMGAGAGAGGGRRLVNRGPLPSARPSASAARPAGTVSPPPPATSASAGLFNPSAP